MAAVTPTLTEGPFDAAAPAGAAAEWLVRVQAALRAHFPSRPAAALAAALRENEAAVINVHDILRGDARVVLGVSIHALPALLRALGIARTAVVARPISWPTDRFEMIPEDDAAAPWNCAGANQLNIAFHLLLVESNPGLVLLPARAPELEGGDWAAMAARVGKSWAPFDAAFWDGGATVTMPYAARFARREALRWVDDGTGDHDHDENFDERPPADALVSLPPSLYVGEDQEVKGPMLGNAWAMPHLIDMWSGRAVAAHAGAYATFGTAMRSAICELQRCARRGGAPGAAARRCLILHNLSAAGLNEDGLTAASLQLYGTQAVPDEGDAPIDGGGGSGEGESESEDADEGAESEEDAPAELAAPAAAKAPAAAPRKRAAPAAAPAAAPRKRAAPAAAAVPAPAPRKGKAPAAAASQRAKRAR